MLWDWMMGSLKPYPVDEHCGEKKKLGDVAPPGNGARANSAAAENKEKAG
ncbi:unnamed protein product [Ectocarpus fasciculatus]